MSFTFQNPFTICKLVVESEIQNISVIENLPRPFGFLTCWLASGYVCIKDTNFCNYKFCSSIFSKISPLKFPPKLQSYISNAMQNFMLQNISFMFHAILFQQIFTIWSQSAWKRCYLYVNRKLFAFQFIFLFFIKERKINWKNFMSIGFSAKNSQKETWQLFPEATHLQKYVAKIRYFTSLFQKLLIKNIFLRES